jgi:hypothetical protein
MNSKLFYEISKELTKAEEELKVAKENYKNNKLSENETFKKLAQCKFDQWQKIMNLLYLYGGK